jgi:hypothetical protein
MKPLLLVNGRPLFQHALDHATNVWGVTQRIAVVSPDNARHVLSVVVPAACHHWVLQPRPDGVIDALQRALPLVRHDRVLILCADNTFSSFDGAEALLNEPYSFFGTRDVEMPDAMRFTRYAACDGGGVRLIEAGSREYGHGCWIGPLVLHTWRANTALQVANTVVEFIALATDGGKMLRPIAMRCADLGVPEELDRS